jgi:hypothetical protein
MTKKEFKLIDQIQRECIESWGLVEDIESTVKHFGTEEERSLPGQWVYIYKKDDDFWGFIEEKNADMALNVGENEKIYLFKLDKPNS